MRIYPDTMVWLYSLQVGSPSYTDASNLLRQVTNDRHQLVSSPLVLGELLVLPKRNGDLFTEMTCRQLFQRSPIAMLTNISSISDAFASVRADHRFSPADALHLSLASVANIDIFVTEDQKLVNKAVSGIGAILTIQQTLARL